MAGQMLDGRSGSCHSFGAPSELFVSDECDAVLLVDSNFE